LQIDALQACSRDSARMPQRQKRFHDGTATGGKAEFI
jgi:hypothetical protein